MGSVDTPGDLKWVSQLWGEEFSPCLEYKRVLHTVKHGAVHILCPPGCVKTQEDVKRKCGVRYDNDD